MTNLRSSVRVVNKFISSFQNQQKHVIYNIRMLHCNSWSTITSSETSTSLSKFCPLLPKNQHVVSPRLCLQLSSIRLCSSKQPEPSKQPCCEPQPEEPKPSLYQRFKSMYRDYWYVLVPVHLVTSAAWFGGFYYMASSGVDIVFLLESLNVSEKLIHPFRNGHSTTGYLAISYALYKIATPLRYTVTLGGTTVSINYLKQWGYIKPVPSKEQLKIMYEDKKTQMKERSQTIRDNMIQSLKPTENN